MKKNNTAQKSALSAETISKALKENTEKTLRDILKEAIDDAVGVDGSEEDAEPIEDDSYEVKDVDTVDVVETPEKDSEKTEDKEEVSDTEDVEDSEDEWGDEYEKYKVGDNEYDFTGVDGDLALKIYQSLKDDDQISVKKNADGNIEVSDNESDAEVVIELEPKEGDAEETDGETEDSNIEIDVDEPEDDTEDKPEDEVADDGDEIEIEFEDDEDEIDENLGYTDNYQKDVIPGLNMSEPADKTATYSMDGGVPTDNSKPWAGKHKEKDYIEIGTGLDEETSCKDGECNDELEESGAARTSVKKSHMVMGDKEKPEGFPARGPQATLSESQAQRILEAAKAIQQENKQIKALTKTLKKSLEEAATLNVNYGKIVKLLVNESTTKAEKADIIKRFSDVKTIKEGTILYESIKRELNESAKKNTGNVLSEQISVEPSKTINETTIFTSANNASLSLMERMDNLSNHYRR